MPLTPDERASLLHAVADAEENNERPRTGWRVLTGAPGSGKTTLATQLVGRKHSIVEDPARYLLERGVAHGVSAVENRRNYEQFQRKVLKRALQVIETLRRTDPLFFDYGVAESLAFLKGAGLTWDPVFVNAAARVWFDTVFFCELIPASGQLDFDPVRSEDSALRSRISELILDVYETLGLRVVRVPAWETDRRIEFVLRVLDEGRSGPSREP